MRLYRAYIEAGVQHDEFQKYHMNMNNFNYKHPDWSGGSNNSLFASESDLSTVTAIVTAGIEDVNSVTVEEVTGDTLEAEHIGHKDLVYRYFKKYNEYPNIPD